MSWKFQSVVYLVLWKSSKSGGTYSEIRRTPQGLNRLLRTLDFMGVDPETIHVIEQQKPYMPPVKDKNGKLKERFVKEVGENNAQAYH
jgi:hypothetical protein